MKLLIVGDVAGGASASARVRRLSEDSQIILFELGPEVSYSNCGLPYFIGGDLPPCNSSSPRSLDFISSTELVTGGQVSFQTR
jgi:NADPH-dependent 2,4-dienoyl-CoA reductase/sulfur reductase-like enzyme